MQRLRSRQFLFTLALASGLPTVDCLHADSLFHLDPLTLEVELRLDGHFIEQESTTGDSTVNQTLQLEERLPFEQSGFVIDPRLLNFSVKLAPIFRQGQRRENDEKDNTRGRDLDYNINLNVMRGAVFPVDGFFNAYRITNNNDLAFGSRSKTDNSTTSLGLNWKNQWLPLNFLFESLSFKQDSTRPDGFASRRDEDRLKFNIKGFNRRLMLGASWEQVDDKESGLTYELLTSNLSHNIHWGRRSSLSSHAALYERTGVRDFRQLLWNERLRIKHTNSLESHTTYRFVTQDAEETEYTHQGSFQLSHQLYSNLTSTAGGQAITQKASSQDRLEYELGGSANYSKSFFFGNLSLGVGADYRYTDRESKTGTGEVFNERHVASLVNPIVLRNQLVIQSTIAVTAVDGFIYEESFDYEISTLGGVYTEIRIIPIGRISPGDTLLISYKYILQPSAEYNSTLLRYNFSYTYRWLRLYHRYSNNQYDLVSGFGLPADLKIRSSGLELKWEFSKSKLRLRTESRYRQNGGLESKGLFITQSLSFSLRRNIEMYFNGSQVFNRTEGVVFDNPLLPPEDQENYNNTDYYILDAGLAWQPRPNWSINPSLGAWKRLEEFNESQVERNVDNLYYSARLRVSWFLRKLSVDFFLDHNVIDESGRDKQNDRLFISVKRTFR